MRTRSGRSEILEFICRVTSSRSKSVALAKAEVKTLLADCLVELPAGGPLSEQKGVFWFSLAEEFLEQLESRAVRLGYTERIDAIEPVPAPSGRHGGELIRWKKKWYAVAPAWEQDESELRESSPDRRMFYLLNADGTVEPAPGYRGDGSATGPKALPVHDARLLLNLVFRPQASELLDPFAGAGGIVYEASKAGYSVSSMDIEPRIAPGLESFGSKHVVGDAAAMPFADGTFPAIATELPYEVRDA
ncbi:MAG: hypothetical protein EA426_03275, partial [Spirochaetaceae bacterium]